MSQIKKDLGDDAVIVSSRTQEDGSLRVSAAIEEEPVLETVENLLEGVEDPSSLFGGIDDYGKLPDPALDTKLEIIAKALMRHNVPGNIHDKIMTQAEQINLSTAQEILAAAFEKIFRFDALPTTAYEQPMMLVGQPGAGKTTTIAKLAARAVFHKLKVVVITADTVRAGGVEQLSAFTRVLNVPLIMVNSPEELKKALNDNKKADQILVDCPGLNAFDPAAMKELHSYTKVTSMDLIVTLPGGMDMEESTEIARALAILGARWILPTRIDMSRRLGGILTAADQAQLSFVGMGYKPDIADGFTALDAMKLANLILPDMKEAK